MIKIDKNAAPEYFLVAVQGLKTWNEYRAKDTLHADLLREQHSLCAYCECSIEIEFDNMGRKLSHIEHIQPKSRYKELAFDYSNLVVSCEGIDQEAELTANCDSGNKERRCGHYKEDQFDAQLFLNPTIINDIEQYFEYDKDNGYIFPNHFLSEEKQMQAGYMIQLLNLNSNQSPGFSNALPQARLKMWKNIVFYGNQNVLELSKIKNIIQKGHLPFISFLRYCLKEFS